MKKVLSSIVLATVMAFSAASQAAGDFPAEQVWEAQITNNARVCGLNYSAGSARIGEILTQSDALSSDRGVKFDVITNTREVSWKLTEAKITDMVSEYSFKGKDDLFQADRKDSSVVVNNREYAWADTKTPQVLQKSERTIAIAPKLNIDKQMLPVGTTKIQGKVVITCGQ